MRVGKRSSTPQPRSTALPPEIRCGLGVAVEAEGSEWHANRAQWKTDPMRVAALERLGWRVLIVTWDDVTLRPAETLDRFARALGERSRLVLPF